MQEQFINSVHDFNNYHGVETLHPLVSVLHIENTAHIQDRVMQYGL